MPIARREAEVLWEGSLARGTGTLKSGSSALDELDVTWAARTKRPDGKTSPEELIAAAHASCFSMALALVLGDHGTPPERLGVTAACTLDEVGRRAADHQRRACRPRAGAWTRLGQVRRARRASGRSVSGLQCAPRQRGDQRSPRAPVRLNARPRCSVTPHVDTVGC